MVFSTNRIAKERYGGRERRRAACALGFASDDEGPFEVIAASWFRGVRRDLPGRAEKVKAEAVVGWVDDARAAGHGRRSTAPDLP